MGVHRLLQRAFARLYGYTLPPQDLDQQVVPSDLGYVNTSLSDQDLAAALGAQNMTDLHFKLKGARCLL